MKNKIVVLFAISFLICGSCKYAKECCTAGESISIVGCDFLQISSNCSDGTDPQLNSECILPHKIQFKWRKKGNSSWDSDEPVYSGGIFNYKIENYNGNSLEENTDYEIQFRVKRTSWSFWKKVIEITTRTKKCEVIPPITSLDKCHAIKPLVGDFNNDGFSDIAYYGLCGTPSEDCWRVHLNNQNGGLTTAGYGGDMWFKSLESPTSTPLVGDFNNDGFSDIAYYGLCGTPSEDCWRVHLNNQNGGFTTAGYGGDMWFKSLESPTSTPLVGDFNNDGFSDIAYYGLCGTPSEDCWRVHLNNQNGGFTTAGYGGDMWFRSLESPTSTPLVGDFNNDGFSDIAYYGLCGTPSEDCWRVHLNNQNGGFTTAGYGGDMWFKSLESPTSTPLVGDFNNDEFSDIGYYGLCGTPSEDCWRVHLNNQNGGFTTAGYGGDMWFKSLESPTSTPLVGDFNNDEFSDIGYYGLCGTPSEDCWRVHPNNQNGKFTTTTYGGNMWFNQCPNE